MKDSDARRVVRAGRQDEDKPLIVGYNEEASTPTPFSGDEDSAYVKVPPFLQKAERYWDAVALDASTYVTGPTIDVTRWRILTAYIDTTNVGDAVQLSLLPEASDAVEASANADFYPVGVVNPVITAIAIGVTTYGSRDMYQTELRSVADSTFKTALAFDVSGFNAFRFKAACLAVGEAPAAVTLKYVLSM